MSAIGSDAKLYPSVLESERSWICGTSSDCRRPVVALHLITLSVEMGLSKLSLIQPKTSHVHVYSASHSVICKPFIGEKLYICQAWVVIDLHNEDLTILCDLRVSPLSTAATGDWLELVKICMKFSRRIRSWLRESVASNDNAATPDCTNTITTTTKEHHQTHLC